MRLELGNLLICSGWIPQKARGKSNGEARRLDCVRLHFDIRTASFISM